MKTQSNGATSSVCLLRDQHFDTVSGRGPRVETGHVQATGLNGPRMYANEYEQKLVVFTLPFCILGSLHKVGDGGVGTVLGCEPLSRPIYRFENDHPSDNLPHQQYVLSKHTLQTPQYRSTANYIRSDTNRHGLSVSTSSHANASTSHA